MPGLLDRIKGEQTDDEYNEQNNVDIQQEWDGLGLQPDEPPAPTVPRQNTLRIPIPSSAGPTVTPAMRKRISAELRAYGLIAVMPLAIRDPVCGDVAQAQVEPICDAIADILGHYPDLAAKFIATGVVAGWVKLAMALKPLAECAYHHHVAKDHPALTEEDQGVDLGAYPAYRPGQ